GNLGGIQLKAGDTLLLEARSDFVNRQKHSKEFLLVNDLETESPHHEKALFAWLILIGIVFFAASGIASMVSASLVGAGLMMASGACSVAQAEKSLNLEVLITIAASFSLGVALQKTGLAAELAHGIVSLSAGNAIILLILCYISVAVLTEMITNNAAAIIMLPIVLNITAQAGLNEIPFVLSIMIAASASFATPLGYQTNLMVYGPGDYRFTDFLKVGIPMSILTSIVTLSLLILGWDLHQ
ncbi:MAG: SLC13 family permease, partial [Pseudomonadota bacterium]|nr:SLC13 family permease [Pseudomonadota bacterium]